VLAISLACLVGTTTAVGAAELRTIRTGADLARTRVVFDMSGSAAYQVFTLANPNRVVIDFDDASLHHALSLDVVEGDLLDRLRYAPRGDRGLRIVLDVTRPVSAKDMLLPPTGAFGHRVVVDLTDPVPEQPAQPVQLIPAAPRAHSQPQQLARTLRHNPPVAPRRVAPAVESRSQVQPQIHFRPEALNLAQTQPRAQYAPAISQPPVNFQPQADAQMLADAQRLAEREHMPVAVPAEIRLPAAGSISLRRPQSNKPLPPLTTARVDPRVGALTVAAPQNVHPGPAPVLEEDSGPGFFINGLAAGDDLLKKITSSVDIDISGEIGFEGRLFFQDPRFAGQPGANGSISFLPEFYASWDNNNQSLLFVPFARFDQHDPQRTHFDIRELGYIYAASDWELRAGIRKVFWGVAESNHLVDIINQTDFVENIDLEDKLGQTMINLAFIRDWGTVDLFILPGFRERTFPGRKGRFQGPLHMDHDEAEYESSAEKNHVDYAMRYSHYFGPIDIGLSHFWGTSREPRFGTKLNASGEPIIFPIYDVIHQTSIDMQATLGNWLLKLESYRRQGQGDTYIAAVGGFEYTYVGVFETSMDIGVLAEYHWDERGRNAPLPFNDDLFVGSRLAVNDAADTQVLGGVMSDLNGTGHFLNVEASRRLDENWKVEVEMRWLLGIERENPTYAFNRDDMVQIEFLRSF